MGRLIHAPHREGAHDIEEGEFCYSRNENRIVAICIWPHGCAWPVRLPVRPAGTERRETPEWELSGPEDAPTLHPSLDIMRGDPKNWHGWVEKGVSRLA